MSAALFTLDQLILAYGDHRVSQPLTLQIDAGEKVAIIGRSGVGKTTLLRTLRQQHADRVAWCPQQPGLVPPLSVFHNVFMGRLSCFPGWFNVLNLLYPLKRMREEIQALLSPLSLSNSLMTPVEQLSGGQQSRVNLARALYQGRQVFIGDEPVASVDEVMAKNLLREICQRHETVIVALHDVELAMQFCHRIVGLQDGKIALDAPTHTLDAGQLIRLYQDA